MWIVGSNLISPTCCKWALCGPPSRSLLGALAFVSLVQFADHGWAQDPASTYPSQTIRIVIPAAPGGTLDVIARPVGQKLSERLGQPVVIENKPGANTIIGTESVAKAPPDGYTLLCAAAASIVTNPAIYPNLRYSIADFAPLSNVASYPFILAVDKSAPVQNLKELVDYIKQNPGKANAGGSTAGHQLMTALFNERTGAAIQYVPFKGMNEVTTALSGGHLLMSFLTASNAGLIQTGAVRALAVTSATRDSRFPDVPTTGGSGSRWHDRRQLGRLSGSSAHAAADPEPALGEIAAIVKLPDVREQLSKAMLDPVGGTPEEFARTISNDFKTWSSVAKAANISIQQ